MNENSIKSISKAVNDVVSTKFILSAQAVSNLLRVVASDEVLFATFSEGMQNFDFDTEFQKACIETAGGTGFHLPYGKLRTVALVTCLLYSFDSGEKHFIDFLQKYFEGENANTQFQAFCEGVMIPYGEAFVSVLSGEADNPTVDSEPEKKSNPVPTGAVVQVEYIVREINANIMADKDFTKEEKEELLILTDGVNRALEARDERLLKAMVVGMKFALSGHGRLAKRVKDIEACLKLYLII